MHPRNSIIAVVTAALIGSASTALAATPAKQPNANPPVKVTAKQRGKSGQNKVTKTMNTAKKTTSIDSESKKKSTSKTPKQEKNKAPLVESYLIEGKLEDGKLAVIEALSQNPKDDSLRFSLGVTQFIQTIERFSQDISYYGLRGTSEEGIQAPFLRIRLKPNQTSHPISYQDFRQIFKRVQTGFAKADETLAQITDEKVQLRLRWGLIRLDLNSDGDPSDEEMLWRIYQRITRNDEFGQEDAENFSIKFDRGDVHWLRGYCNLIGSLCQMFLAYDSQQWFESSGHIVFAKVVGPYGFLTHGQSVRKLGGEQIDVTDLIASIHNIHWEVKEPERLKAALLNLENVVEQSKISWNFIMAETDDDCEWLPNPRQTGVIPNVRVTEDMVKTWGDMMNQSGKVLRGELLVPFWRGERGEYGVNLRRVFLEPRTFDLVTWVQGTAAQPYLEKGHLAKGDAWKNVREVFGNRYIGFAAWFN